MVRDKMLELSSMSNFMTFNFIDYVIHKSNMHLPHYIIMCSMLQCSPWPPLRYCFNLKCATMLVFVWMFDVIINSTHSLCLEEGY